MDKDKLIFRFLSSFSTTFSAFPSPLFASLTIVLAQNFFPIADRVLDEGLRKNVWQGGECNMCQANNAI